VKTLKKVLGIVDRVLKKKAIGIIYNIHKDDEAALQNYLLDEKHIVVKGSDAYTSAMLLFRLGKIPKIVYIDNGKAFTAKYFHGNDVGNLEPLFARLGIKTIFAKAYHAQSKPIEPFWDWMAELERMIPTYVGTSIEMQPPRLHRGEFLHRKLYDKAMQKYFSFLNLLLMMMQLKKKHRKENQQRKTSPTDGACRRKEYEKLINIYSYLSGGNSENTKKSSGHS
jgi:hypothetical protein